MAINFREVEDEFYEPSISQDSDSSEESDSEEEVDTDEYVDYKYLSD